MTRLSADTIFDNRRHATKKTHEWVENTGTSSPTAWGRENIPTIYEFVVNKI